MRIRDDEDLNSRVISYIYKGNYKMVETLFDIGFLRPDDTFDITGRGGRGNPEDSDTMLSHIARWPCPNYKELIDILLKNGSSINYGYMCSPLQTAITYRNFPTAAYLMHKGGEYVIEEVYNHINLINEVNKELDILVKGCDEWRGIPLYGH